MAFVPYVDSARGRTDWSTASLGQLIDHTVRRHHAFLRAELPRLAYLLSAARCMPSASVAGDDQLAQADVLLRQIKTAWLVHFTKEEAETFPAIRQAEGWVAGALPALAQDNLDALQTLEELVQAVNGRGTVPVHLSDQHRAFLSGLETLENEIRLCVRFENDILFPRAIAEIERSCGC